MKERVTLRPGDYVSTAGMTEDQYHAVARAFMAAGAKEFGSDNKHHEWSHVVWYGDGDFIGSNGCSECRRHLTPAQVIGAVNAGNQQEEDNMTPCEKLGYKVGDQFIVNGSGSFTDGSKVELFRDDGTGCPLFKLLSGYTRYALADGDRGAYVTLGCVTPHASEGTLTALLEAAQTARETADQHQALADQASGEHDRLMQRARDMLPDGWRLVREDDHVADMIDPANWRVGDRVECVADPAYGNSNFADGDFEVGGIYTVHKTDGSDCYGYLDESGEDYYEENRFFRFHHRPT